MVSARQIGLVLGPAVFAVTALAAPPLGMSAAAWLVAGLVVWMAVWWMTEAIPLSATALLPFVVLPLGGVMSASEAASNYYAPILFLLLGGAFIALAIERTGLHRRLSLAILKGVGSGGGQLRLLFAFMVSAAVLSMLISNTSTALIMMPMALAVLAGGSTEETSGEINTYGLFGALPMGIAFAASMGGLGTIVGSPTNGIAVQLLDDTIGLKIGFATWMMYGLPVVVLGVPVAALIVARVHRINAYPFDVAAARATIESGAPWSSGEKRVAAVIALAFAGWTSQLWVEPLLPKGSWTDGTIAALAALALFVLPDGSEENGKRRRLLEWHEADRAPWGVILMFGGGLALAAGMQGSGLAEWLGQALLPLETLPLILITLAVVAMVVLVTEFASNVATASAIIPIIASLAAALGLGEDAILIAMPAALAASWGFILPAASGPNAIAWATGRLTIDRLLRAGLAVDIAGIALMVGVVWAVAAVV